MTTRKSEAGKYRSRTIMLSVFNAAQVIGFYGFNSWVPTLLINQGITATSSLFYTSVIALAAPLGPVIGFFIADRFERKTVIVAMALTNIVCGLIFSQVRSAISIILMGVGSLLTGLAIYKPAQLGWMATLLGGYQAARVEHFLLTVGYVGFFVVHIAQVIRAGWNNFRAMVMGYEIVPEPVVVAPKEEEAG